MKRTKGNYYSHPKSTSKGKKKTMHATMPQPKGKLTKFNRLSLAKGVATGQPLQKAQWP